MAEKDAQPWPKVSITLYDAHNAEVQIAGRSHQVNSDDPRASAIGLVSEQAAHLGRPVKATATEADGTSWRLIIHPDGTVQPTDMDKPERTRIRLLPVAAILLVLTLVAVTVFVVRGLAGEPAQERGPEVEPTLPSLPEPRVVPDQFVARPVPRGWSTNAKWTVDLAEGTHPAVSPTRREVAIINPEDRITVFDSSGKVLWQDEVPASAESPVWTIIDDQPAVVVAASRELIYWRGSGALPTAIELPLGAKVQFFGSSPLVTSEETINVVSGGELRAVESPPRLATVLLAEGANVLMARYRGPLYWSEPGKNRTTVGLKPPSGANSIDHVAVASRGRVVVHWNTATPDLVIPAVHSTATGAAVAVCSTVDKSLAESWDWVPDPEGKGAAYGECLIGSGDKTFHEEGFQALSVAGGAFYGSIRGDLVRVVPGGEPLTLAEGTARPWGIAGSRAIVVHEAVLYALEPASR